MTLDLRNRPVVVVPVHRARPSPSEIVSLRHCGKVLGNRDIVILAPRQLDLGAYRELLPDVDDLRVESRWMSGIDAYNRMMISPLVFTILGGYTHMILHEPDAIVLRDEIDYWCSQPFDYIGAPWFEGWAEPAADAPVIGVGNLGLSFHRLAASRRVTASWLRWHPYKAVVKDLIQGFRGDKARLRLGLIGLGSGGRLRGAYKLFGGHCDAFWSFIVPDADPTFRIPPADIAVQFAWEVLPSRCMEMCRGSLPFGIHAWFKYDFGFLMPHLLSAGVDLHEVTQHDTQPALNRTSGSNYAWRKGI
jgi:hypothetical protein